MTSSAPKRLQEWGDWGPWSKHVGFILLVRRENVVSIWGGKRAKMLEAPHMLGLSTCCTRAYWKWWGHKGYRMCCIGNPIAKWEIVCDRTTTRHCAYMSYITWMIMYALDGVWAMAHCRFWFRNKALNFATSFRTQGSLATLFGRWSSCFFPL